MSNIITRTSPKRRRPAPASELIFVYGSLCSAGSAYARIAGLATFVDTGSVAGRLFDLGSYPGAVLEPEGTGRISGEVHALRNPAPALAALDAYEGLGPEGEYVRTRCSVATEGGRVLKSWIYLYARPIADFPLIPEGDYLAYLKRRGKRAGRFVRQVS